MPAQKILVIEDDAAIRRGIVDVLEFNGFETFEAEDGDIGLEKAVRVGCDLILLDLILPGADGLTILKEIRATRPTLPVIILTALGGEEDRVRGLQLGADDYVVKPFSVRELLARVKAVLRRSPERPTDVATVRIPGAVVDFNRCEARFENDGERVELSPQEMNLLRYLIRNSGRVISREELLSRVWRISPHGLPTRTIDMHIARLREKLRDDSSNPGIILTVRGKGYMFSGETDRSP